MWRLTSPSSEATGPGLRIDGVRRWVCGHRYEPFWMKVATGSDLSTVPTETQFLLVELEDHRFGLVVPLLDGPARAALSGGVDGSLHVSIDTGDSAVTVTDAVVLFAAVGDDPYVLAQDAARSVAAHHGSGRLRTEKPLPRFVDQFGWCTWDSFYRDVSEDKVRLGLESFAAGGISPRLLILDDGWQSIEKFPGGEERQTAFAANAKFPAGLGPTVDMAKNEFGIETFLVWHAIGGYWGGADPGALPGYGIEVQPRTYSASLGEHATNILKWFGAQAGVVPPEHIYRFYQDFHRELRRQGVDGVKVDNQASIESTARGTRRGRVGMMRAYREALEGSTGVHFSDGGGAPALINCMSCSSDMLYQAMTSNLTRTSTDFWPNDPQSHGQHLYINAVVSYWFGEFIHPDWDMFQSGHANGAFHAAGRAVSGSPVYVSDKPEAHDFALLRKLVLADGSLLRCAGPGRPTRDCLFHDPTREDVLLKIFNRNADGGVIGVFNARAEPAAASADANAPLAEPAPTLTGSVRPSDVAGITGERFAVYAHHAAELRVLGRDEAWEIALAPLTAEVFTVAPIRDGVAVIGLADKLNSGGAVLDVQHALDGSVTATVRGDGELLLWAERVPAGVLVDGNAVEFGWAGGAGAVRVRLSAPRAVVRVVMASV